MAKSRNTKYILPKSQTTHQEVAYIKNKQITAIFGGGGLKEKIRAMLDKRRVNQSNRDPESSVFGCVFDRAFDGYANLQCSSTSYNLGFKQYQKQKSVSTL